MRCSFLASAIPKCASGSTSIHAQTRLVPSLTPESLRVCIDVTVCCNHQSMHKAVCGFSRLCSRTSRMVVTLHTGPTAIRHRRSFHISHPRCQSEPLTAEVVVVALRRQPCPISQFSDEDYLTRARAKSYPIYNVQQLDRQGRLSNTEHDRLGRLVDREPYRSDLDLWHLLLDYQLQHHGLKGVSSIRCGLRYRARPVDLSSEDDKTTALWHKLLSAAIWHKSVDEVRLLVEEHGVVRHRPHLFSEVVGTALRYGEERLADVMVWRLANKNFDGVADVLRIFRTAMPEGTVQIKAFCVVHSKLNACKMYDQVMQDLWAQKRADDAFLLHKYLIEKGDLPSSFEDIWPFISHLAREGHDPRQFLRRLAAAGASFAGQGVAVHELETKGQGGAMACVRIDKVSDTFAAKAFATRALPFDFVLGSLQAFGLTQIGPQAIRELGLAASDTDVFAQRLARLDQLGVDTGSSVYSRLVRRLCFAKEHTLLSQALQTDMHHEVFESRPLLRRLLSDHLHNGQWDQVNLLLATLNHGDTQSLSTSVKLELIDRAATDPRTLLSLTLNGSNGLASFGRYDLHAVVAKLLRSLRAMELDGRSRSSRLAMTHFTAGIMQDAVTAVGHLKVYHWIVLISQYGKLRALDEIAALSHWIAKTVAQGLHDDPHQRGGGAFRTGYLRKLFNHKYQAAMMHWAMMRTMITRRRSERERWKRTLLFFKHLEDDFGIQIYLRAIRKVVVMRCRSLSHRRRPLLSRSPVSFCSEVVKFMQSIWSQTKSDQRRELAIAMQTVAARKSRGRRFDRVKERRIRGLKIRGEFRAQCQHAQS